MSTPSSPLAIAALESAYELALSHQGETPLVQQLGAVIQQLHAIHPDLIELAEKSSLHEPGVYGRVLSVFGKQPDLTPVFVVVERNPHARHLHPFDVEIAGRYMVCVPGYLSDELQAAVALDQFHMSVPIKQLDDFGISVIKAIEAPGVYENNTLINLGSFADKVELDAE